MLRSLVAVLVVLFVYPTAASAACPPKGYDRDRLAVIKAESWQIASADERADFSRRIIACLASPDPALRDGVAFEALSALLRSKSLSVDTMNSLHSDLEVMITGPDRRGFARPFAALALAEIARADRIEPFLTTERRNALLDTAVRYVTSVEDYRGFNQKDGWRHGVAHGADLLMQLALNPALGRAAHLRIRDAVSSKIAPQGHFYVFGESERLARPILFIAQRGEITEAEWTTWLREVTTVPAEAFGDMNGLARRHNVSAFLSALYIPVTMGGNNADDALVAGLNASLRAMP